jgi:autotransporter-associated beta strand protein
MTIASGSIVNRQSLTLSNTTVAFPSGVTGYIHQGNTVTFSGTSNVTGDSGLVISGYSVNPYPTNSYRTTFAAANGFTGGLYAYGRWAAGNDVMTAGVNFTTTNQLGAAGEGLFLSGAELSYTNATTDDSLGSRPIELGGPGMITVVTAGRTLTVPGTISGPGVLFVNAGGTLNLTNPSANTYSGGTSIQGPLQVSSAAQLGTGTVFLGTSTASGTLRAAGNLTFGGAGTPPEIAVGPSATLDAQANTVTLGTPLSSSGTLTKLGTGTLILSNGGSTFTGAVTVSGGTLLVTGKLPGAAAAPTVTVQNGATLAGTGTIGTTAPGGVSRNITVAAGGTLVGGDPAVAAGSVPGTLTVVGNITLQAGSNLRMRLTGGLPAAANSGGSSGSLTSPPNNGSLLQTSGTMTFDPTTNAVVDGTGVTFVPQSYSYKVAQANSDQSSLNITNQAQFAAIGFTATNFSLTGDVTGAVFLNFTPVPEPATVGLVAAAGLGLVGRVRRKPRRLPAAAGSP